MAMLSGIGAVYSISNRLLCKMQTRVNMAAVDVISEYFMVAKCLMEMRKKENRPSN